MRTETMTIKTTRRMAGFTMVELLIAIVIIGILVTIIVPVLSNRAAEARIAAAKSDMEAIANAESQAALDTGYVFRLHVLDDSGAVTDNLGSDDLNDVIDTIRDEGRNNSGQPELIFLDAKTGIIIPTPTGNALFDRVELNPDQFGWKGPYVNYHRKIKGLPATPPVTPWTAGSPLDPWGRPYFLFVGGESVSNTTPVGGWVNEVTGTIDTTFTYEGNSVNANTFDRLTLLSLGPNGIPGDTTTPILGAGDDLVRAF